MHNSFLQLIELMSADHDTTPWKHTRISPVLPIGLGPTVTNHNVILQRSLVLVFAPSLLVRWYQNEKGIVEEKKYRLEAMSS